MRHVLIGAAVYNLAWAALLVVTPAVVFEWAGIAPPNYPQLVQALGMLIGVLGLGYGAAAISPLRHWPVTAVGTLAKVLGPFALLKVVLDGVLPWKVLGLAVANDVLWWAPMGWILWSAYQNFLTEPDRAHTPAWQRARTEEGVPIGELSFEQPVLIVALRHGGCTFCREALADVARSRAYLEERGIRIVLAHMGTPNAGALMAARYGLSDLDRIADPNRLLYHALGLHRAGITQVLGPKVIARGVLGGALLQHGIGLIEADPFQLGGVFLLDKGRIVREFRYESIADRPDLASVAS